MASRFTLSAQVGQIEPVSTSRIPQIIHIFGLSAIHVSFTLIWVVVAGQGSGVKGHGFVLDRERGLAYNNALDIDPHPAYTSLSLPFSSRRGSRKRVMI
jgi:hypothetical protein